jgi:hypothetical protein
MSLLDFALIYSLELHLRQFGIGERVTIGGGVDIEFLDLLGGDLLVELGVLLEHFGNVVKPIKVSLH